MKSWSMLAVGRQVRWVGWLPPLLPTPPLLPQPWHSPGFSSRATPALQPQRVWPPLAPTAAGVNCFGEEVLPTLQED